MVQVPVYQAKAELFRVIGHPARIRILEMLSERDHAVHELLAELPMEPPSLSQQLAVLRRSGLVQQERARGEVRYSLTIPQTRDLLLAARALLRELAARQVELHSELGQEPPDWSTDER